MQENLPFFKYHPNPIETGSVETSDEICLCCIQNRGYIYKSSIYTAQDLVGSVCPWCIADGSAAKNFEASFSDNYLLLKNSTPFEIVEEVTQRTPGFESWQQEVWISHCGDACEFHGDLPKQEAKSMNEKDIEKFALENQLNIEDGKEIVKYYEKGGNPAIYKFICRHCGEGLLYTDCT